MRRRLKAFTDDSIVTPDTIFNQATSNPKSFILFDRNADGQYDIEIAETNHFLMLVDLQSASSREKALLRRGTLPVVFGRSGEILERQWDAGGSYRDVPQHVISFWPSTVTAERYQEIKLLPIVPLPKNFKAWLNTVLPILQRTKLIQPNTHVFDFDAQYRGTIEQVSPPQKSVKKFDFYGLPRSLAEIVGLLHAGDAATKERVRQWLCEQTDPDWAPFRERVHCGRFRPRLPERSLSGPSGIEFRRQRSIDQAWEADQNRKLTRAGGAMSRRDRLAAQLVLTKPEVVQFLRQQGLGPNFVKGLARVEQQARQLYQKGYTKQQYSVNKAPGNDPASVFQIWQHNMAQSGQKVPFTLANFQQWLQNPTVQQMVHDKNPNLELSLKTFQRYLESVRGTGKPSTSPGLLQRALNGLTGRAASELLPGGLADDIPDAQFDPRELAKGVKHEREHTDNSQIAKEIAKDHLFERGDYYDTQS